MAIEQSTSGATIITGPDIRVYALMTLTSALAMKANHGMELTRIPALQGAKNLGIIPQGKRGNVKQALELTIKELTKMHPNYQPSEQAMKALGWVKKDAYDVVAGDVFIVDSGTYKATADATGEFRPHIETEEGPLLLTHGQSVIVK